MLFYGQPYRTRSIVLDGRAAIKRHGEEIARWRAALSKYTSGQ